MAFTPIKYDSGDTESIKIAASTTIAKWDALVDDWNGLLVRATSGASEVRYVSLEAKVSWAAETPEVLVVRTDKVLFEADTNAAPEQTDVFTKADLTDHDTLNESASTNDVFFIEKIVGATTDKKVQWYFCMKTS